jgi:hypothetical protein
LGGKLLVHFKTTKTPAAIVKWIAKLLAVLGWSIISENGWPQKAQKNVCLNFEPFEPLGGY